MNSMQQEFDIVVAHLFKQGRPATNKAGFCMYRSGDLSCAIGCRIPDKDYSHAMEGLGIDRLITSFSGGLNSLPREISEYKTMFDRLQRVHDVCEVVSGGKFNTDDLTRRLDIVAYGLGLEFTVPEEVV